MEAHLAWALITRSYRELRNCGAIESTETAAIRWPRKMRSILHLQRVRETDSKVRDIPNLVLQRRNSQQQGICVTKCSDFYFHWRRLSLVAWAFDCIY